MTAPRSFTPEERRAWVPLTAIVELLPRHLDSQLTRDEDLTHFDYAVLSMLALTKGRTLRMSARVGCEREPVPTLARSLAPGAARFPLPHPGDRLCARNRRDDPPDGRRKAIHATPGHVATVRAHVLDAPDSEQLEQLHAITQAILERLDPDKKLMASRMT
ncbi:hypothetical protein [Rhodococcus opacus]|uniref:hypothetical protein n=1 Tax=Rhodococcus opacus TaxID=37919 RepID=UPI000A9C2498|nr:hypothetical protein [Rhodococcus opacus]